MRIPRAVALLVHATLPLCAAERAYEQGLTFRLYEVREPMEKLPALVDGQTPNVDEKRAVIDFTSAADFGGLADYFIVKCSGQLVVPAGGIHAFRLVSDDGARLTIGGAVVIDHDGVHAATALDASMTLEAGAHPFELAYFENNRDERLLLEWQPPGATAFATVPATAFQTEANVTRVVAPGKKNIIRAGDGMRPGNGAPLAGVHPSWTVATIRPDGFRPMVSAMAFDPSGRLLVATFTPDQTPDLGPGGDGKIWALSGVEGADPAAVTVAEVAAGLSEPLGMAFIGGDLHVTQRLALTKLRDLDRDGTYETQSTVASGWQADNYHHFHFGLVAKDGHAYSTLSTAIMFDVAGLNGPNPPHRGTLVKTRLDTGEVSYIAGGLRTPNGLCLGPEGEIFNTDNQGGWLPTSKLQILREGSFHGFHNNTAIRTDAYPLGGTPSLHAGKPVEPPVVFLPQNEISNSPTQPVMFPPGSFYEGQMLIGELTLGGIGRVFLEKVDGVWQGAAFRFTQGLEGGVMRLAWGPDGALYAGCMGGTGNWSWNGTTYGLQRLSPKSDGTVAFEMKTVKATPDGFAIEYTKPLHPAFAAGPESYGVHQWTYRATEDYGGPKVDEQSLTPAKVSISADRKTVDLVIPGLKQGYVVHLKGDPASAEGEPLWSTETWYTLNRIPANR